MKDMSIAGDRAGRNTFAIPFPDNVHTRVLTGTAKSITVPVGAAFASFSATADVWVNIAGTAVVASGDSDTELSELNPGVRVVQPGQTISVNGTCTVVVTFYA